MESTSYSDLMENMCEQILVFEDVLNVNNHFRESIISKDWAGINTHIDSLNELSTQVNQLDSERVSLLLGLSETLNSETSENCYSILQHAPVELKDRSIEIFYKLKSSVIQAQGVFKGLSNFVEHKKDISKEIINVLVKDSKGNVYSKPGRRDLATKGFLVDRQL